MADLLFDKKNMRVMLITLISVIIPVIIFSTVMSSKIKESIERQHISTMQSSINERLAILNNSFNFVNRECFEIAHNPLVIELMKPSDGSDIYSPSEELKYSRQVILSSLENYFHRIVNDSKLYVDIFLIDKNGSIIANASNGAFEDFNFKEMSFFNDALNGTAHIQEVIESPYTNKPIMIISNPIINSNNEIMGVAATVIDFHKLTEVAMRESDSTYITYGIVNDEGIVIAHSYNDIMYKLSFVDKNESLNTIFKEMQQGNHKLSFYELNNVKKVMSYAALNENKWFLFCSVNIAVYMAPIIFLRSAAASLVIFCTIVACLIILRTSELRVSNSKLKTALEELKEAQSQLIISEKMAALGVLVAGIAHEINTPVGIGVTAVSHLKKKTDQFYELYKDNKMKRSDLELLLNTSKEAADMIYSNLLRASSLIQSFKRIAVDQSSEENREFNLKEYINEIILSLKPVLKKTKHNIHIECPDNLIINSYPGAFSQIINNFIINSLRHGYDDEEAEGNIKISVVTYSTLVTLKYSDDGKGMEAHILERIFDPFFTTKRGSGGSGMGLNIVYNIATKELNGTIKCKSEPGKGTEFTIIFPLGNSIPN